MSEQTPSPSAKRRLPVLATAFPIVVACAWIFERRGPAFPQGNFGEVVAIPVLLLVVAYLVSLFTDIAGLFREQTR